jgi:heat shock protein HslJ
MQTEDRFLKALESATQFSFRLGKLVLDYKQGETYLALMFERATQE